MFTVGNLLTLQRKDVDDFLGVVYYCKVLNYDAATNRVSVGIACTFRDLVMGHGWTGSFNIDAKVNIFKQYISDMPKRNLPSWF